MLLLCWLLIGVLLGGGRAADTDDVPQAPEALAVRRLQPRVFAAGLDVPRRARLVDESGAAAEHGEIAWAFVRVAGMQENRQSLEAADGWWALPTPAALADGKELEGLGAIGVVGVDLRPRVVEVSAADLRAFIEQRGTAGEVAELPRQGVVRVERVESFKAILRFGGVAPANGDRDGRPPSQATSKTGQQVEIRPLMDPAGTLIGSDVAVRAYVRGNGAAGGRVRAVHVATGEVQDVPCAETGIGLFTLAAAGEWRVEMHVLMREGPQEGQAGDAKWVLYSGMLVFEAVGQAAAPPDDEVRP